MNKFPTPNTKLGVHYFPDTLHYRDMDLRAWLPELNALGVGWLTLLATPQRAIPETFLNGLISAEIEPVIHFALPAVPQKPEELKPLLRAYASWGVNYVSFFDRPNMRQSWPSNCWIHTELVERFLDIYMPVLQLTLEAGLIPVLPPLEPGGDYWDTAFLRALLQGLLRRAQSLDLDQIALGAYGWLDGKPINWGAGGPERWPGARPYFTPSGEENQCGFHIFDWYSAISKAVLGKTPPILLIAAGENNPLTSQAPKQQDNIGIQQIAQWIITREASTPEALDPARYGSNPDPVLAYNLWLLAAAPGSICTPHAWYRIDGSTAPVVGELKAVQERTPRSLRKSTSNLRQAKFSAKHPSPLGSHPLGHYLLLPPGESAEMEHSIEALQELVDEHQPTFGYSIRDASLARIVTVLGSPEVYPEEQLDLLRAAGCQVVRMQALGTELAQ